LNFAYIACIWAGDGFSAPAGPPGTFRCKHRYLGIDSSFGLLADTADTPWMRERCKIGHPLPSPAQKSVWNLS
jgi:hypothetical protein